MPVASSPASAPRAGGPVDPFVRYADVPAAQGLYDPSRETENCGLAVIATLRGTPGHDIVQHALTALRALEHRGAVGADEGTGDGAGLLTQIPDELFRAVVDAELPPVGEYVAGTAFQEAVWRELRRIPPGETRSYAEIAAAVGKPGAVRAAGSANGANHVAVLIPCHRVVRSDGSLGGYAGGVERKRRLLEAERRTTLL